MEPALVENSVCECWRSVGVAMRFEGSGKAVQNFTVIRGSRWPNNAIVL
jgi:hypothetical protein